MDEKKDFLSEDIEDFSVDEILKKISDDAEKKLAEQDKTCKESSNNENNDNPGDAFEEKADKTPLNDSIIVTENNYPEHIPHIDTNETNEKKPEKTKHKKEKSKKGFISVIIWVLAIAVISFGLAFGVMFCVADCMGIGKSKIFDGNNQNVLITVKEGETISNIAQSLEDTNVILSDKLFLIYLKITGKGDGASFSYGVHSFLPDTGYNDILSVLAEPALKPDISIRIKSAMSIEEIGELLEKNGVCKKSSFLESSQNDEFNSELVKAIPKDDKIKYRLEGYLYPDTYQFYNNDSPKRIIQCMLDNLESKFTPEMRSAGKAMGYSTHQILSLASVIEMECCGYSDQMPKVSAVFHNRLNNWNPAYLQSDPTMKYPYGNGAFDTYKTPGIPVGPCSNCTVDALKAAVTPDKDTSLFYFVTDKNGRFYYSKTNEEHNGYVAYITTNGLWAEQ